MISNSTYQDVKRQIAELAANRTKQLENEVLTASNMQAALQKAKKITNSYHREYIPMVYSGLSRVGMNAIDYYAPNLTEDQKQRELTQALDSLTHNRYYGLTLPQRLAQSNQHLNYNLRRSSLVGAKPETRRLNITRVLSEPYPFGAHKSWDTRLFLAEAVRLEHELAQQLAHHKDVKFVKWTRSKGHVHEDICDKLARAVDKEVEAMLPPGIKPDGVYFIDKVPPVPHPNCQCVIKYVGQKHVPVTSVGKASKQSLIQRILSSIFRNR